MQLTVSIRGDYDDIISIVQHAKSIGLSPTRTSEDTEMVLDVVKRLKGCSRNMLAHRTPKLNMRRRNIAVDELVNAGKLRSEKRGKKITYFLIS